MMRSLLTALLLGLFPAGNDMAPDRAALQRIAVAPPSIELAIDERISASGVVVYDLQSGQNLFARDARVQRPMASLTKLMTALLIVEGHELDEIVTVPQNVVDVSGNVAYLPPGAQFRLGDLLSALLINSANDAALALAQYHSGSVPAFVAAMNERALELGMTGTSFRNPAGLDHVAHWSTPRDIAWLTAFSLRYDDIAKRLGRRGQRIASVQGDVIQLYHTHALLHDDERLVAGKTGTTNEAGECLMSVVAVEDKEYVVVLMNSAQRYKDMQAILAALSRDGASVAVRHDGD